ncbi:MAG: CPBP family intramembrane metalloprotease [Burkholderiales bacterium]|nr:CPBP family intramembrane metalloprotease [Burkholderiales bacterium]
MTDARSTLRRAVLAAAGYIAIMAVGMFTAGRVFGLRYGETELVYVLVFFEVAMSVYAVVMARRIFGTWNCGFSPVRWNGMWWLLPNFAIMAALFAIALGSDMASLSGLALVVIVTMILVGFSEELMFRGIVLQGGLREVGMGKAILISAALFSLLHSVNVLAFVPLDGMLMQLGLTFVFGLAMACYALRINSLVPLMVFHALWDMVQLLGGLYQADFGPLIVVGIVVNLVFAAALWWLVLRKRQVVVMGP